MRHLHAYVLIAIAKGLEEALNCYSPDDTAQDWEDKIEALKESK